MSRHRWRVKKLQQSEREMTTPLFLLRCLQVGLSIRELDLLTVGMVNDIFIENSNDDCEYATIGGQGEMDAF